MPDFGWSRLAYLLSILTVLVALVQLGGPDAGSRSLASEPPPESTAETNPLQGAAGLGGPERISPRSDDVPRSAHATHRRDAAPVAPHPDTRPPVFYRPSFAGAAPEAGNASKLASRVVCGGLARFPGTSEIVFPLAKGHFGSYEDTWGAARPQGGHEGTDLMVPTGTPEYAMTDGTIVPVSGSNDNGWNTLGGYAVMLEAAYSVGPVKKGDLFYYAHLNRESTLEIGTRVRAGQVVGLAGDTGQGPEATRGLFPPHLHLGWYDASGARSDLASGAMNPYPLLEWVESNGGALRGGSDARYCHAPQTGTPIPSTGEERWPIPADPGARPDLDTGSDKPSPSPAAREKGQASNRSVDRTKKAAVPNDRPPEKVRPERSKIESTGPVDPDPRTAGNAHQSRGRQGSPPPGRSPIIDDPAGAPGRDPTRPDKKRDADRQGAVKGENGDRKEKSEKTNPAEEPHVERTTPDADPLETGRETEGTGPETTTPEDKASHGTDTGEPDTQDPETTVVVPETTTPG